MAHIDDGLVPGAAQKILDRRAKISERGQVTREGGALRREGTGRGCIGQVEGLREEGLEKLLQQLVGQNHHAEGGQRDVQGFVGVESQVVGGGAECGVLPGGLGMMLW